MKRFFFIKKAIHFPNCDGEKKVGFKTEKQKCSVSLLLEKHIKSDFKRDKWEINTLLGILYYLY